MPVGWISLLAQFGAGYKNIRQFRFDFKKALKLAVGIYPDARVSVDENGIVLHPSRPPVAKILRI
jgi:hypothetical protein